MPNGRTVKLSIGYSTVYETTVPVSSPSTDFSAQNPSTGDGGAGERGETAAAAAFAAPLKGRSFSSEMPDTGGGQNSSGSSGISSAGTSGSKGALAKSPVSLGNAPFYGSSTCAGPSNWKSGDFYLYDGIEINGRYRVTLSPELCGKQPVGQNVTGWVPASAINGTAGPVEKKSGSGSSNAGSGTDAGVTASVEVMRGDIGGDAESLTYTDCAADQSDSVDISIDAEDEMWLQSWFPQKGSVLRPKILGFDWEGDGDSRRLDCGLFVLDDVKFSDTPSVLEIGGVSKPSDTDFSELEREKVWKNTSIKRIGTEIAGRYGMGFSYDAEDYDIECDEQEASDSSYYNTLCKNYGLILKVYSKRLWVYDREAYKNKPAVKTFSRSNIKRGSMNYSTTLSGTFTGGQFSYTDPDKNCDIVCTVGGGKHTKSVSRKADNVHDASVQLCAEINNANHGTVKLNFTVDGDWSVSAANNIRLEGYGKLDGKYFVDRVTHHVTRGGGFTSDFECSGILPAFHYWDVGGTIQVHEKEKTSGEDYSNSYDVTSPAANAASGAAGAVAGGAVTLDNAPFYYASTSENPSCYKSGTFYYYDAILVNGRYRMTISADRCGKLPIAENVTGWVPASYCNGKKGGDGSESKGGAGDAFGNDTF